MKKSFLAKFAAVALVMGTVVTALPVSATIYCSQTIIGKGETNKEKIEGQGIALRATADSGWGSAFGRQSVSGGSDKRVAAVSVDAGGQDDPVTDTAYFDADGSSYYIYWTGNSRSKGHVRFID